MIDMSYVVADAAAADLSLAESLGDRIYADELPHDVAYPCMVVRELDVRDAAPPTFAHQRHELQVDVVGAHDGFAEVKAIAYDALRFLRSFRGVVEGGGVNTTDVPSLTFLVDDSISPARPRWVLAVEVTARTTTEGG